MGGQRIYLFYGWNRGSQPPLGARLPRTDMQLDEGFWMRWSDDFGKGNYVNLQDASGLRLYFDFFDLGNRIRHKQT